MKVRTSAILESKIVRSYFEKENTEMTRLPLSFFQYHDTLSIAKKLLGKFLMTRIDGVVTGGMIIETEAYVGTSDKASHAYKGRRTKRTEVMFHAGGRAYVYVCYGMHTLFNIITNKEGEPHGVLIRAIEPSDGIEKMIERRHKQKDGKELTSGPAMVTQALGITARYSGTVLDGTSIWVEDRGVYVPSEEIVASPRVGIAYAEEYAAKPWRFRWRPGQL